MNVPEVLHRETEFAQSHEEMIDLTPRPNRRLRDYGWAMALVNVPLAAAIYFLRDSITVVVYASAGMVLLSIGITWIVWVVMDRY